MRSYESEVVMRRYSDFEILYNELRDQNLGCFIPPIPQKSVTQHFYDDGHPEVEDRKRGLQRFLTALVEDK